MNWTNKVFATIPVLSTLLALSCFRGGEDEPVMGRWESVDAVGGYYNSLYLDDEFDGTGRIYFTYADDDTIYYANFLARATIVAEDSSYIIDMICSENFDCSDFDFSLYCDVYDTELMDCVGDGAFESYGYFYYQRPSR